MLKSREEILESLSGYRNKNDKISRMLNKHELFRLNDDWYETDPHAEPVQFVPLFKQPSYLSFESALSWYGMIPEAVHQYTCAATEIRKTLRYSCWFGTYTYQNIPVRVFYMDIHYNQDYSIPFLIASREKALSDLVFKKRRVKSVDEMERLLFDNLRIDEDQFYDLSLEKMEVLSSAYHSTNVDFLRKVLKKWKTD